MSSSALVIDMIVVAAGETRLAAYVEQTFSPEVARLGHYTADNAVDWLDVDGFMRFLDQPTQNSSESNATASPQHAVQPSEESRRSSTSSQRHVKVHDHTVSAGRS
ncbi:hypothetical protein B0H19DRAFT_1248358 [Mycena capillaripes]|nr:hypothetical protein B0H19DRAFT_1248358 [Mycena capillaripes]